MGVKASDERGFLALQSTVYGYFVLPAVPKYNLAEETSGTEDSGRKGVGAPDAARVEEGVNNRASLEVDQGCSVVVGAGQKGLAVHLPDFIGKTIVNFGVKERLRV